MMLRRVFLLVAVLLLSSSCNTPESVPSQLSIGVVSFEESDRPSEQNEQFETYLSQEMKSFVQLEPTYNELKALEEIKRKTWDIVFAPPGLAAIAISQSQYIPLFPLEGSLKNRSVIIILRDNPITDIRQLAGKRLALGQRGSATGYYLPIYNLYGLTLAEIRLAPSPKIALQWLAEQEVDASAMSLEQYNRYRSQFPNAKFRVLYTDAHSVPSGAVLVSPALDQLQQDNIRKALSDAPSSVAASVGYISNAPVPDYQYLIEVVQRVGQINERIKEKPAPLYEKK